MNRFVGTLQRWGGAGLASPARSTLEARTRGPRSGKQTGVSAPHETRATLMDANDPAIRALLGLGPEVSSGVEVSESVALGHATVNLAMRVLMDAVMMCPLHVYQSGESTRRRAREHRLYSVLNDEPNLEMTPGEWKEWQMANLLMRGNGYSQIVFDGGGRVKELWPLRSDMMEVKREGTEIGYWYRTEEKRHRIPAREVLHLRAFWMQGLVGCSSLMQCAESVGLAIAQDRWSGKFYGNGAYPGGLLETDLTLDSKARDNLAASWAETHGGLDKAHLVAVLEQGLKWKQTGVSPKDSQLIEGKTFSVQEVSRIFNVPPHRLYDLSRATYSNIEHAAIEFVMYSLGPWLSRIEQRCKKSLLSAGEKAAGYYVEFLAEGLLRGDLKTRYEAYGKAIQDGWMSPNEARVRENLEPDTDGNVLRAPVNAVPIDIWVKGAFLRAQAGAEDGHGDTEDTEGEGEDGDAEDLTAKNAKSAEKDGDEGDGDNEE